MRTISLNEVTLCNRNLNEIELRKLKPYVLHLIDSELNSLGDDQVVNQFMETMKTSTLAGKSALDSLTSLQARVAMRSKMQDAKGRFTIAPASSNKSLAVFYLSKDDEEKLAPDHLGDNAVLEKIVKICTEHLTSKLIVPGINSDGKFAPYEVLKFEVESSKISVKFLDCGPLNSFDVAMSDLQAHYPDVARAFLLK